MKFDFHLKAMTETLPPLNNDLSLKEDENKNNNEEPNNSEDYQLTCLQAMLLNKKLPQGYKFELREIYEKTSIDYLNHKQNFVSKKRKNPTYDDKSSRKRASKKNNDYSDDYSTSQNRNQKRSAREKKPNHKEDLGYVEQKIKCKDPKLLEVAKRCEKILSKLRRHPYSETYFSSTLENSLSEIDKKVKNYQFSSVYVFGIEVRKVWKHYFTLGVSNPEIYQKTIEISAHFEELMVEVEDSPYEGPAFESLSKKIQKIESQIQMDKKNGQSQSIGMYKQPSRTQIPLSEKPMTIQEKNQLGNNIRSLTPVQMKEIISILSDHHSLEKNSKYFEFDIDKLPTKKLRDLEKYVKKCLKTKGSSKPKEHDEQSKQQESEKIYDSAPQEQKQPLQHNQPKSVENNSLGSLSSSDNDDDSESLSSLNFKK